MTIGARQGMMFLHDDPIPPSLLIAWAGRKLGTVLLIEGAILDVQPEVSSPHFLSHDDSPQYDKPILIKLGRGSQPRKFESRVCFLQVFSRHGGAPDGHTQSRHEDSLSQSAKAHPQAVWLSTLSSHSVRTRDLVLERELSLFGHREALTSRSAIFPIRSTPLDQKIAYGSAYSLNFGRGSTNSGRQAEEKMYVCSTDSMSISSGLPVSVFLS